jgi:hypothetical protein
VSRCQLGERAAVIRVRIRSEGESYAAAREARARLSESIRAAGRDHELGQFIEDAVCQKGRDIVFKFRKAPENR